jgi:hypothetical protein
MPAVLTMTSQEQCPHGGIAIHMTANTLLMADESLVLLESDIHPVVGCPFTAGLVYMPCLTIEWAAGATSLTVNGTGVLTETSIGKCLNASQAPQGIALVSNASVSLEAV